MVAKGSKNVPIIGSSDKRMITATFTLPLTDTCSLQFIYTGKTKKRLSRVTFPSSFSLSFKPKHYSNKEESIKVLNDFVIPYVAKEREKLELNEGQAVLLIMDVFKRASDICGI